MAGPFGGLHGGERIPRCARNDRFWRKVSCSCQESQEIKSSGQECPLHTTKSRSLHCAVLRFAKRRSGRDDRFFGSCCGQLLRGAQERRIGVSALHWVLCKESYWIRFLRRGWGSYSSAQALISIKGDQGSSESASFWVGSLWVAWFWVA